MKKLYKLIAMVLMISIVSNFCLQDNTYAKRKINVKDIIGNERLQEYKPTHTFTIYHNKQSINKNMFVDGKSVNISTDDNNNITLSAENDNFNSLIDLYSDGTAGMIIKTNNEQHNYVLQINELIAETGKIDIKVFEGDNLIKSFNSLDDVQNYSYSGQIAIPIGWAIGEIIAFCISALIAAGIILAVSSVATVYGYDWYDGQDAYEAIKSEAELKKYYYPTLITNTALKKAAMGVTKNYTYIALYAGMDLNSTKVIVDADKPIDIYAYSATLAAKAITNAGFKLESSSTEKHTTSGLQFPHFHKVGHLTGLNEFHALCAAPTLYK